MDTLAAISVGGTAMFALGWMTGGSWYRARLRRALRQQRAARQVPPITGLELRRLLETLDAEQRT